MLALFLIDGTEHQGRKLVECRQSLHQLVGFLVESCLMMKSDFAVEPFAKCSSDALTSEVLAKVFFTRRIDFYLSLFGEIVLVMVSKQMHHYVSLPFHVSLTFAKQEMDHTSSAGRHMV